MVSIPVDDDTQELPDTGLIDAIPDAPDPPAQGMQIVTPVYRVEPYSEVNYCMFGSFEGDGPMAINYAAMYEDEVFGHHINSMVFDPVLKVITKMEQSCHALMM